jgi:hypothetical protein
MTFVPKYTISDRLLSNIARIHTLAAQLNSRRFRHVVLLEFERIARAVSAHASTSIEGIELLHIRSASGTQSLVLRVQPMHRLVLALLGPPYEKIYKTSS